MLSEPRPEQVALQPKPGMTIGSTVRFHIARWSAWRSDKNLENKPEISELPMLMRRRASLADRMALRVAFDCVEPGNHSMPAVFCSRHGEVHRSVELLETLAKDEPLSPMDFSLSVHNTAAALYSIARGDTSPMCALAAGQDSLAEGVFEACGILSEGSPQVLLVAYDDQLPVQFKRFTDDTDQPGAIALLLEPAGQKAYSLELRRSQAHTPQSPEPQILSVTRFLESVEPILEITHAPRRWIWRRNA